MPDNVTQPPSTLRRDAESIWCAGVAAVDSERLVAAVFCILGDTLEICGRRIPLDGIGRIAVVGGGKAGAGMAAAVERILGETFVDEKVSGWVNVPEDCLRPLRKIHLHAARPAGHNEPTQAGVDGSLKILASVAVLGPNDLCIVLLSGGGSALLPAPVSGISLADKQAVTRLLMQGGATIDELNCVRKQLSQIKGGRLAAASSAGITETLIISDVIGDPLDVIASGPTVPDSSTPADALSVLRKYDAAETATPTPVIEYLHAGTNAETSQGELDSAVLLSDVRNSVIGNNATALAAAESKARELGYRLLSLGSDNAGEAVDVGSDLADRAVAVRDRADPAAPPVCLLSGGEPVVRLAKTDQPRKGGRNQELVLSAVQHLWDDGMQRIALLSGGTDGEDGPTDAAGAVADADLIRLAKSRQLSPLDFLRINNSYPFFAETNGLLMTGPTHTNVMDLRVILIGG
ncbi:MAG: DUF4147 domain-containing protein [Planctomycetes bacterium]|nr:DUF4147 domain-containing protein [Planctomycetota bacterium]